MRRNVFWNIWITGKGTRKMNQKLSFSSDYMEGAHPEIIKKLVETNMEKTDGYGFDPYTASAIEKIRAACNCPEADVRFLAGGTQTNAVMIDAFLRGYEGVLCAQTGHISLHEAGAIEHSGHKVLTLPQKLGKISAGQIRQYLEDYHHDVNCDQMVFPGMVYITHPTEYGTLYSLSELEAIHAVCREFGILLYLDGARLAYALACRENDISLADLARLCDAFYIGGTKCGALFGEAVVVPDSGRIPHFFSIIKQHGALVAKGRITGIQFDVLFEGGLYKRIGVPAIEEADRIRRALKENGYQLFFDTPTNQVFCVMNNERLEELGKQVGYGFWEKYDESHTVIRFATSWATRPEDVDALIGILENL